MSEGMQYSSIIKRISYSYLYDSDKLTIIHYFIRRTLKSDFYQVKWVKYESGNNSSTNSSQHMFVAYMFKYWEFYFSTTRHGVSSRRCHWNTCTLTPTQNNHKFYKFKFYVLHFFWQTLPVFNAHAQYFVVTVYLLCDNILLRSLLFVDVPVSTPESFIFYS